MKNMLLVSMVLILSACAQPRNGVNGAAGTPGAPGHDGANPTPTSIVPLCLGVPTYGTTYVEDAICLQGQLYGVYSANGGFLTQLPPGAYTSSGIGSSCNFTVGANCSITH